MRFDHKLPHKGCQIDSCRRLCYDVPNVEGERQMQDDDRYTRYANRVTPTAVALQILGAVLFSHHHER